VVVDTDGTGELGNLAKAPRPELGHDSSVLLAVRAALRVYDTTVSSECTTDRRAVLYYASAPVWLGG